MTSIFTKIFIAASVFFWVLSVAALLTGAEWSERMILGAVALVCSGFASVHMVLAHRPVVEITIRQKEKP